MQSVWYCCQILTLVQLIIIKHPNTRFNENVPVPRFYRGITWARSGRQSDMLNLIGECKQILSPDASKVNEFLTNQTEQIFLQLSSLTELRKGVPGGKCSDRHYNSPPVNTIPSQMKPLLSVQKHWGICCDKIVCLLVSTHKAGGPSLVGCQRLCIQRTPSLFKYAGIFFFRKRNYKTYHLTNSMDRIHHFLRHCQWHS